MRYYPERRDAEFENKMAEVLRVCHEVAILKETAVASKKPTAAVAVINYDGKARHPGDRNDGSGLAT